MRRVRKWQLAFTWMACTHLVCPALVRATESPSATPLHVGPVQDVELQSRGTLAGALVDGAGRAMADREVRIADLLGREVARHMAKGGRIENSLDFGGRVSRRRVFSAGSARALRPDEPEWLGRRADGVTVDRRYRYDTDGELVEIEDARTGRLEYQFFSRPACRLLRLDKGRDQTFGLNGFI